MVVGKVLFAGSGGRGLSFWPSLKSNLDAYGTVNAPMATDPRPEVVRERADLLPGGRASCALILDRELTRDEVARFYLAEAAERPYPMDFDVAGRVIAWECRRDEAERWRLALEIFLVKSFRGEGREAGPLRSGRPTEPTTSH